MEANVKPGTRCECPVIGNTCHDGGGYGDAVCQADSARVVVVRDAAGNVHPSCVAVTGSDMVTGIIGIPMCAACAEYHEARQKAGA